MNRFTNKSPLIFILILSVISALLYFVYEQIVDSYSDMKSSIELQQVKRDLVSDMYNSARERSIILLSMYVQDDPFEIDELWQEMGTHARTFIRARQHLMSMELDQDELHLLNIQAELTTKNVPYQEQAAELMVQGEKEAAGEILFERAIPGQTEVLQHLSAVVTIYNAESSRLIGQINDDIEGFGKSFFTLGMLLLFAIVIGIALTAVQLARQRRQELKLKQMLVEKNTASEKLSYQASHDALTGLYNRTKFETTLNELLEQRKDLQHVVFYLDLDQFKVVNDSSGHHAGDELLRQVADVIKNAIRQSDILARLGGDEFGVILERCGIEQAKNVAHNIIEAIGDISFVWEDKTFRIGVSIGIVQLSSATQTYSDVLKMVDAACFAAKDAGRNRYHIYSQDDKELQVRQKELSWISRVEQALINDTFVLYAQPIVSLKNDSLPCNFEVLIRLQDNGDGLVPPGAFLPAAERYNKMNTIDRWVITHTFAFLKGNQELLDRINYCSINISNQSFSDDEMLPLIVGLASDNPGVANKICFEVTETAAVSNLSKARNFIASLSYLGFRFALDDFGSGISSFGYLKNLEVQYLKIDGVFVKDIVDDPIDLAMVSSIHEVGTVMGKKTVAEFVESLDIIEKLKTVGVDYAQGYALGRPMPIQEILNYSPPKF